MSAARVRLGPRWSRLDLLPRRRPVKHAHLFDEPPCFPTLSNPTRARKSPQGPLHEDDTPPGEYDDVERDERDVEAPLLVLAWRPSSHKGERATVELVGEEEEGRDGIGGRKERGERRVGEDGKGDVETEDCDDEEERVVGVDEES